jgi:ATP-dependent Lhr-like helicase
VDPLASFDPRTRQWFESAFDAPTDIQSRAWPVIARGDHVLLTAPTGSGKTLTAFLWALDRLATGAWDPAGLRLLYISPLKALNRDIAVNLLAPLEGMDCPQITVGVRSGDTDASERRRQFKKPPSILVTTPESLHLLLSSHGGRRILGGIKSVILDEIHAVADSKRGTLLMTAVERLTELSGEFQRVALSATVNPLDRMAAFAGGAGRDVQVVVSEAEKKIELGVHALPDGQAETWTRLAAELRKIAENNRSTLVFVNNRALSERLVRHINEDADPPIAYAHHGSLAHATRRLVEEKLKRGELKAIVATSSLELGIDIGALDEVVLVQSPPSLHSAVQRVGRAGHQVGAASVGRIYPTGGRDFVDAAVVAPLVRQRIVEPLRVPRAPLDVLAQVLVAMCGVEERHPDSVFQLLRRSDPYRDLSRASFDRVVAMLCGRYADSRIRELKARLHQDPETGRLRGASGVLPLVWRSGGVIPDRGYYTLRIEGQPGKLGELDEEFVWERRRGDLFRFGAQTWQVQRIRRNDVEVVPSDRTGAAPPFWRAEAIARDFEFCSRIGDFLEEADRRIDDPAFRADLMAERDLSAGAADHLLESLRNQRAATRCSLPHRHHIVVEHPATTAAGGEGKQVILHATWGARLLRPLEIALAAAWAGERGERPETFSNNDSLMVTLPGGLDASDIFRLVTPERLDLLVRTQLERSGFFASRFRENAQRALLLPRRGASERTPLWLNRLRSNRLMRATRRYDDFPLLAETWRTCLEDEFDLPTLRRMLEDVANRTIRVSEVETAAPSPFAASIGWRSVNSYMYDDDAPLDEPSRLSDRVIRDALHDAALRPRIEPALAAELEAKLLGVAAGYAPDDDDGWRTHVEERLLVRPWSDDLPAGLERVSWGGGWVVAARQHARIERARQGDAGALAACIEEQLRYRGPVTLPGLATEWDLPEEALQSALATLAEAGTLVADKLTRGATQTEHCDAENLERLLRMGKRRPSRAPRPFAELAPFLAARQGVLPRAEGPDALRAALESLFGYGAPAALWEEAILPARVGAYRCDDLDALMRDSELVWYGTGTERTGFAFDEDLSLFVDPSEGVPEPFPEGGGRYDFFELQSRAGTEDTAALAERIWELAFAGRVTNEGFAALRQGVQNRFRPAAPRKRRRGLRTWQATRPLLGSWRALSVPAPDDELDALERDKERARVLLARYGVVCRALLKNECAALGWGRLQRALRLMELAGEVVGGTFFEGLDGLQFMAPEAMDAVPAAGVWWVNAHDPASLCGAGVDEALPPRAPSTFVVRDGSTLALVVHRNGKELRWEAPPRAEYLGIFDDLMRRSFRPMRRVEVETIDGEAAARHASAGLFLELGFHDDRGRLVKDSIA